MYHKAYTSSINYHTYIIVVAHSLIASKFYTNIGCMLNVLRSKYDVPSVPEGGVTATRQKLPRVPQHDYSEPDYGPDRVDPIYEDLEASVQDLEDVVITEVDNPTYNISVQTTAHEPKAITATDAKTTVQEPKGVADTDKKTPTQLEPKGVADTDAKIKEDPPPYDSSTQRCVQKPKDAATSDVKMQDNPAYESSLQPSVQESKTVQESKDTTTDGKTEDSPVADSSKEATTDDKTEDSSAHADGTQSSVQEPKDAITTDVKVEDNP